MSVISCDLHRDGWTGSGGIGQTNEFTVQWLVQCNDQEDGPLSAVRGGLRTGPTPLAAIWDVYRIGNDYDPRVRLQSRSSALYRRTETGPIWLITGQYGRPGTNEQRDNEENPLRRPTKYRIDWANYSRIVEQDIDGKAILNAADQEFAEPLQQDDNRLVLVATRNLASLDHVIALGVTYQNTVNKDPFYGAARRQAKCESITAGDQQIENDIAYYATTFKIQFSREGWERKLVNRGFSYYNSADKSTRKLITARHQGDLATSPVLLAEDGTKLAAGEKGNFLTYRTYPETLFRGMNI